MLKFTINNPLNSKVIQTITAETFPTLYHAILKESSKEIFTIDKLRNIYYGRLENVARLGIITIVKI